jgi:hypothetical protein
MLSVPPVPMTPKTARKVGMQRQLHHTEVVWLMWERRCRIQVYAAAVAGSAVWRYIRPEMTGGLVLETELVLVLDRPGFGPPPVASRTPARMRDCCQYGCSCEVGVSAITSAARLVEIVFGCEVDPVHGMP